MKLWHRLDLKILYQLFSSPQQSTFSRKQQLISFHAWQDVTRSISVQNIYWSRSNFPILLQLTVTVVWFMWMKETRWVKMSNHWYIQILLIKVILIIIFINIIIVLVFRFVTAYTFSSSQCEYYWNSWSSPSKLW